MSLIRRGKDFILILAWGWSRLQEDNLDITYPHIHDVGIFDAWLIAKMRDITWLINSNGRVKGIDISTPIINSDRDGFKAEEGNLGKLMRIHMSDQTSELMPSYEAMKREADAYTEFKEKILFLGLHETIKDINNNVSGELRLSENISKLPTKAETIGVTELLNRRIFYIAGNKRSNILWDEIVKSLRTDDIIVQINNKLAWKVLKNMGDWSIVTSGKKADIELKKICSSILGEYSDAK